MAQQVERIAIMGDEAIALAVKQSNVDVIAAVSYTHLTLPTN